MKKFKQFVIRTEPFNPDLLSGLLWELNISGLTEEADSIQVFAEDLNLSKKAFEDLLKNLKDENLIQVFSVEEFELENKNWNEEWERSLYIIKVTDRIIIKPSFREYLPNENEIVITIDPKMSFGTGEHQTTKLMLKLLEKYINPGMKILDVGSGTAVLAIASIKLGAEKAIAIDNDELCFENGIENCKLNNVNEKVEVRIGELKNVIDNDFDLILANIQKNILIDIADHIVNRLKKDGLVILSGLLAEDELHIVECYKEKNLSFIERDQMDEWIALVFKLNIEN